MYELMFPLTIMCISAFICHHNSFLIYGSLKEPTLNNWSRITHVSVLLAVVISVLFAACGYMTFTGYTEGKLLNPSIFMLPYSPYISSPVVNSFV